MSYWSSIVGGMSMQPQSFGIVQPTRVAQAFAVMRQPNVGNSDLEWLGGNRRDAARFLSEVSVAKFNKLRWEDKETKLPDVYAGLYGMFELSDAGELEPYDAVRIVPKLWALAGAHPTKLVKPELWRKAWELSGPTNETAFWDPPEEMTLLRGARDEVLARGWSWTVSEAIARWHAEGHSKTSNFVRHAQPRMFRTTAPRDALLAKFYLGGEMEIICDPDKLGEVVEVSEAEWRSWPAPIKVRLANGQVGFHPDCHPWNTDTRVE